MSDSRYARCVRALQITIVSALIAGGASAQSLPTVSSGALPGPPVLYDAAPAAPQLENRDPRFTAAPLLVMGHEAYVEGEYLYQDFIYDDWGSNVDNAGQLPLCAHAGDITYPTNTARYGSNAADLVEFRIAVSPSEVAYRITLNTLLEADSTMVVIAYDTDLNPLTGKATLPRDPGAAFPGTDEAIFVWGTGAEHVSLPTVGTPVATGLAAPVTDLEANQITVTVPRTVSNPSGVWRTTVAVGLYNTATGGWLRPAGSANATTPGGAGGGDLTPTGIFNVAFRFSELACPSPPDTLNCDVPPDTDQGAALLAKSPTTFANDIDFAKLDAAVTESTVPASGQTWRIFPSRLQLGEGRQANIGQCSPTYGTFPQYLGQLQPYGLFIPSGYTPGTPAPLTLNSHSLGEHYWQYNGAIMNEQMGEARGSFVATALARGWDGWYQNEAEYDVFEMWNDIAGHFTLDPDSMVSSGYSMGGYATYRLCTLYPDLCGAAFTQVGPPADGVWIPPGPPTGGVETLTNNWLENARHVPYLNIVATNDELVPIVGPRAQNLGAPEFGIDGFEQLGYRFRFLVVPNADHLAMASAGYDYPFSTSFLGSGLVDRNPPHVTFAYVPDSDDAALGLVHDHAYWVSDVTLADPAAGSPAKAAIDLFSYGFGLGDPPSVAGTDAGTAGAFAYSETNRAWGAAPAITPENRLDVTTANLGQAVIDCARASLDPSEQIAIGADSDVAGSTLVFDCAFPAGSVVLQDGLIRAGASAGPTGAVVPLDEGSHSYQITTAIPGGVCGASPAVGCRRTTRTGKARIDLRKGDPASRSKSKWVLSRGEDTPSAALGDPTASTSYQLCMYSNLGDLVSVGTLASNAVCSNGPKGCWKAAGSGFKFKSRTLSPDGLKSARVRPGTDGKAKLIVKGRGSLLDLPTLPVASLPLRVQMVNTVGECWEAEYLTPQDNDGSRFKAKGE